MEVIQYIADFFKDAARQGPGCSQLTREMLELLPGRENFQKILDIGCGTGAQSLVLAENTDAEILAVDTLGVFLDKLRERANLAGLQDRISPIKMSMDALDFSPQSFDLIWSEGAIYNIGFELGLTYWRPFLKTGGCLVVTEISWLTDERPKEIEDYWVAQYPQIATIPEKIQAVERSGYTLLEHRIMPERCWTQEYYASIRSGAAAFLEKHPDDRLAEDLIREGLLEADFYDKYKEYYSYVYYLMQKE